MTRNGRLSRTLLAWLAAAILAGCLLVAVGATPVWAALWGFTEPQNFPVGESPLSITGADFNGDGKKDVAVANFGLYAQPSFPKEEIPGGVSVLLGNGDGTFKPKQEFEVASNLHPRSVTSAHFDGDALADLVVPNAASDVVSVFLSSGDGTFEDPTILAAGDGPLHATSSDFDGDGKQDLAVVNKTSDDVSILLGNGDGNFQEPESFPAGDAPESAINADFDGDGFVDLVALRRSSDAVSVLLGNGDGSFQEPKSFAVEDETTSVTSADFNEDGKVDLTTAHRPSFGSKTSPPEGVSVFLSNGDGTFQAARYFPVVWNDGYRRNPEYVIAADLNGDRTQDIVTTNRGGGVFTGRSGISVLLGRGDGTFLEGQEFEAGINPSSLIAADLDADSFADLAVADDGSNDLNFEKYPDDVWVLRSDQGPARTNIDSAPPWFANSTAATFTFSSPDVGVSSFECKLDDRAYKPCESPQSYTVSQGSHTFEVRAIDAWGTSFLSEFHHWTADTRAPRVGTVDPANSATGVRRHVDLKAVFSERVHQATISESTFKLYKCRSTTSTNCAQQITDVAVDLTRDSTGATDGLGATLNPYGSSATLLSSRTKYRAIVTTGVTDEFGNALDQNAARAGNQQRVWYFTTR